MEKDNLERGEKRRKREGGGEEEKKGRRGGEKERGEGKEVLVTMHIYKRNVKSSLGYIIGVILFASLICLFPILQDKIIFVTFLIAVLLLFHTIGSSVKNAKTYLYYPSLIFSIFTLIFLLVLQYYEPLQLDRTSTNTIAGIILFLAWVAFIIQPFVSSS